MSDIRDTSARRANESWGTFVAFLLLEGRRIVTMTLVLLLGLGLMGPSSSQDAAAQQAPRPDPPARASGLKIYDPSSAARCVNVVADVKNNLVFSHPWRGPVHKRIEKGLGGRRWNGLHVVGGLVPTPNVASQLGSIDQTADAVAWISPRQIMNPYPERPERIVVVRSPATPGSCPAP